MALFREIQEYIALDPNNLTLVFDSGNIVNISGNIFLYPPQGHPILYKYVTLHNREQPAKSCKLMLLVVIFAAADSKIYICVIYAK